MKVVFYYSPNQPSFLALKENDLTSLPLRNDNILDTLSFSNYLAKKSGFKTALVTTKEGSALSRHINYDEVHICPHELENEDLSVAVLKLYAFSAIKERFIFCHPTVFITSNTILDNISKFENSDIVFTHENFNTDLSNMRKSNILCIFGDFLNLEKASYKSYNIKLTIVNNFEAINKIANELLNFIIEQRKILIRLHTENHELFSNKQVLVKSDFNYIITTIWFQQLLSKYNIKYDTFFNINNIGVYSNSIKPILNREVTEGIIPVLPISLIKDLDSIISTAMYKKYGIYCAEILIEKEVEDISKFALNLVKTGIQF